MCKNHIVGAAIGRPLPQQDTHKRTSDARPYEMFVIIVERWLSPAAFL